MSESKIIGRPALLWRLEYRQTSRVMECLSAMTASGQFRVWLSHAGQEQASALFDHAAEGVHWSIDLEQRLTSDGWSRLS